MLFICFHSLLWIWEAVVLAPLWTSCQLCASVVFVSFIKYFPLFKRTILDILNIFIIPTLLRQLIFEDAQVSAAIRFWRKGRVCIQGTLIISTLSCQLIFRPLGGLPQGDLYTLLLFTRALFLSLAKQTHTKLPWIPHLLGYTILLSLKFLVGISFSIYFVKVVVLILTHLKKLFEIRVEIYAIMNQLCGLFFSNCSHMRPSGNIIHGVCQVYGDGYIVVYFWTSGKTISVIAL